MCYGRRGNDAEGRMWSAERADRQQRLRVNAARLNSDAGRQSYSRGEGAPCSSWQDCTKPTICSMTHQALQSSIA